MFSFVSALQDLGEILRIVIGLDKTEGDLGRLVAASANFSTGHLASERFKPLAGVALAVVDKTDGGFTCHWTVDKRMRIFSDRLINEIVAVIIAARGPLEPDRGERSGSEFRVVVGLSETVGVSGRRSGDGRRRGSGRRRRQNFLSQTKLGLVCRLRLECAAWVLLLGSLRLVEDARNRSESVVGRIAFSHLAIPVLIW